MGLPLAYLLALGLAGVPAGFGGQVENAKRRRSVGCSGDGSGWLGES